MTVPLSIPVTDATVLLGEPMTASCQALRTQLPGATGSKRCLDATQNTVSPAAVSHLWAVPWMAVNPMDFKAELVRISALLLGVSGSTHPVRCGARPLRAHRGEPGRGTVVGP